MSNKAREKGKEFSNFLRGLSLEERSKANLAGLDAARVEHQKFQEKFRAGDCFTCNQSINSFDEKTPCPHWLLKPNGFKKKHFPLITENFGLFQLQSFLRWVANEDGFARNINETMPEENTNKLIEVTIRYRNLEWSFSCSESDYLGHANSLYAKHPHYHFQMRVDQFPFIDYSNFHTALCEREIITLEAMRSSPDIIKPMFPHGEGIQDFLTDDSLEHIINSSTSEESDGKAPFKIDTIVVAEEGKTFSGKDLHKIFEEAKARKVTVASLMHKLPHANVRTIVSPGPGTVEQSPRTKRGKNEQP